MLSVPPHEDVPPATWVVRLDAPLGEGHAIRLAQVSAEYREGGDTLNFVSSKIDGALKRLPDRDGHERYALKAVASEPSVDVQSVGRRGVEGVFDVERQTRCR